MQELRFKKDLQRIASENRYRDMVRKFYQGIKECTEELRILKGKKYQ